jgi:hypothetical protein
LIPARFDFQTQIFGHKQMTHLGNLSALPGRLTEFDLYFAPVDFSFAFVISTFCFPWPVKSMLYYFIGQLLENENSPASPR